MEAARFRICVIIALGFSVADASRGIVISLDDRFMEEKENFSWLVEFYAPWCGHCKKLMPVFEKVAADLANSGIRVAKLDSTLHSAISTRYEVRGFPTIKFVKGDKVWTYAGDRSVEDISRFATRAHGPSVTELTNVGSFRDLVAKGDTFFVFAGDEDNKLYRVYKDVAEKFVVQADFFVVTVAIVSDVLGPDEAAGIYVLKDGHHYRFNHADSREEAVADSLHRWVNEERFGIAPHIRSSGFHDIASLDKRIVILLTSDKDVSKDTNKRLTELFRKVATARKGLDAFQFVLMEDSELVNNILMTASPMPSLLVFDPASQTYFIPQDSAVDLRALSEEQLVTFLEDIVANRTPALGGNGFFQRIKRLLYEIVTMTVNIWLESRLLFIVVICLPLLVVSLIVYTVCCVSWGGDDGDEEGFEVDSTGAWSDSGTNESPENVGHAKSE